jgi:hypothetical protein
MDLHPLPNAIPIAANMHIAQQDVFHWQIPVRCNTDRGTHHPRSHP